MQSGDIATEAAAAAAAQCRQGQPSSSSSLCCVESSAAAAKRAKRVTFSEPAAACSQQAPGSWADPGACHALCLLILDDRRSGSSGDKTAKNQRRNPLPPELYADRIASFLRFDAPLPNMLYAFGGRSQDRGPLDTVEMFDTWHGHWVAGAPMPTRRAGSAAALLPDGRMLIVGGYDERGVVEGLLATCDLYDPFAQRWYKDGAPPLARARWGHGCATLCAKVYVVGGCALQPDVQPSEDFMETLKSCEVLDLNSETPKWTSSAPLQIARSGSRVVALQGDRYLAAIGGCDDTFGHAVELFDVTLGYWTLLKARLNHPRTTAAAVAIGPRQLLVVGGARSLSSAERYEIALPGDERSQLEEQLAQQLGDMPDGRMGCQAAVINLPRPGCDYPLANTPCAVIVGGERIEESDSDSPRFQQFASVPTFDIELGTWREDEIVPQMASARTAAALCVGVGHAVSADADVELKRPTSRFETRISNASTACDGEWDSDDDDDDDGSTRSAASLWS